jgi:hypothetical protein
MKKSERRVLVLAVVVIAVIAVQVAFTAATERSRKARLASFEEPASVEAYRQLAAEMAGTKPTEPVAVPQSKKSVQDGTFPPDAAEIVADFEQLFIEIEKGWVDPSAMDVEDILKKDSRLWTESEWALAAQFVADRQDLVRQIRAMAARGGPAYVLDFSQGYAMDLQHLGKLRAGARLLRLDAIIKASEGNYVEAVEDVIAGMQLGDVLAPEPVLISQLVRIASYNIMYDTVQESFHVADMSPELIEKLFDHIDQADNRHAFAQGIAGERTIGMQLLSDIRSGKESPTELGFTPFPDTSTIGQFAKPVIDRIYAGPVGEPMLNMIESKYTEIVSRTATAVELPYYEALPELNRIEHESEMLPRRYAPIWMLPGAGAVAGLPLSQARHEAKLDLMQMGLVLEQYQADHGSYPDTLDAIEPRLGGSLPVDPFSGEQYHYRPTGDSFRLYSVGRNLTDDGGIDVRRARFDDLVWRGKTK